jgi:hypothetical protein
MEGDGNQKIEGVKSPITIQPFCHPLRKKTGEMSLSLVFPTMDSRLERPFESPHRPRHCKIFSVGHTSATRMVLDLFRDKGNPTNRTKGRFNPADLRKTI